MRLSGPIRIGEGVELVHEPLRMYPAERVLADRELTGIIAQDHGVGQEAVRLDAPPQPTFPGQTHRIMAVPSSASALIA